MNDEFKSGRLTSFGVGHKRGRSGQNDGFLKVTLEEDLENSVKENNYDSQESQVDDRDKTAVNGISDIMNSINKLDELEVTDTLDNIDEVITEEQYQSTI